MTSKTDQFNLSSIDHYLTCINYSSYNVNEKHVIPLLAFTFNSEIKFKYVGFMASCMILENFDLFVS